MGSIPARWTNGTNGVGSSAVESRIVIPVVVGSNPIQHPKKSRKRGRVWFMATVLKTVEQKCSVSSNLTVSARNKYIMKNIYHHRLDIPVKFVPVFPENATIISNYDIRLINKELVDWLQSLNVVAVAAEIFHQIPDSDQTSTPIHVDAGGFDDRVKLNFVYTDYADPSCNMMNWYVCKDPSKLKPFTTSIGSGATLVNEEDCELVYSAQLGMPSLINAGILHGVSTVTSERYCFSLTLTESKQFLKWDRAVVIFKDYISLM